MSKSQFITYAQNGEDVLLWRALKHVERGFYIDVGAQDPIIDSVTKAFYDRGWRGINIEPVRHWYDRLVEQRPRDVNLCIAASDHAGDLKLYESDDTGLSTSVERFAHTAAQSGWQLRENTVPCKTLAEVCKRHVDGPVHFLKVDCEGAEADALRGMPLDEVRPWIVLVEASEPNSSVPTHDRWESLLTRNGYEFVYGDGINRYYVAVEHAALRAVFGFPPNALDDYIHASELRAREFQREMAGLKSEVGGRGAEIERLQRGYRDVTEEREAVRAELALRVEAQRAQLTEISRLQDGYRALGNSRALLEREVERHVGSERALTVEISRLQAEYRDVTVRLSSLQREHAAAVDAHAALGLQLVAMQKSRSWRLTASLRALRRACGKAKRGAIRCTMAMLRPSAHALRPALRRLACNKAARGLVVRTLGQNAAVVRHGRLFLFGVPPRDAATPSADAGSTAEPDDSVWSRRERIAMSELQRTLKLSDDTGGRN